MSSPESPMAMAPNLFDAAVDPRADNMTNIETEIINEMTINRMLIILSMQNL
jgi:hypothetical protein